MMTAARALFQAMPAHQLRGLHPLPALATEASLYLKQHANLIIHQGMLLLQVMVQHQGIGQQQLMIVLHPPPKQLTA